MNENENMKEIPTRPQFASQWDPYTPSQGQVFTQPSCTIPDQSMTIPEIIARFTRTGMVPGTIAMRDQGGNVAADPESDPLDDFTAVQAAAAAARAAKIRTSFSLQESESAPAPRSLQESEPAPAPAGA